LDNEVSLFDFLATIGNSGQSKSDNGILQQH